MDIPVDLTNLRSMTDGDAAMEKELFTEFFLSFEKGISVLQANYAANNAETWSKQAHALKGIALNLGAEKLGALCKQAQEQPGAPESAKKALQELIWAEYEKTHQFLLSIM